MQQEHWNPLTTQEKVALSEAYKDEHPESLIDAVSDALYKKNHTLLYWKVEELRGLMGDFLKHFEKA